MALEFDDLSFPNREPNHILRTDLATANGPQVGWLHLYLPQHESEQVFFEVLGDTSELSLDDSSLWTKFDAAGPAAVDGRGSIVVEIPRFAWLKRSSRPLAPGRSLTRLRGEAFELRLQHDYSYIARDRTDNSTDADKVVTYALSENRHLGPGTLWTRHFDGQRTFDRKNCLEISLDDHTKLTFDTHYTWFGDNNGSHAAHLVATARSQTGATFPIGIPPEVEDAVLLLSFLTATRTIISKVSAWDGDQQYEYFRPRFGFPDDSRTGSFRFGLIALNRLEEYFAIAWARWQPAPNTACLRNAIYAVLPGTSVATPLSFQRCYGALEALVKAFAHSAPDRRTPTSLSPISAHLQQLRLRIANHEEAEIIESLDAAISKFSEPTFREHFSVFCEHWEVPLGDLWPMFAKRSGLAFLRNRITHGATFEESEGAGFALWVAQQHLEFTLSRVMCAVLGIPLNHTELAPNKHATDLTMFTKFPSAFATVKGLSSGN
jgi:hypothetical protein